MTDYEKLLRKQPPPKKKVPYLKYALITFLYLFGLFLVVSIGWGLYFRSQFLVYHDDQYKFSIRYPKTWKILVHPKKSVAVIFIRPQDTALDTLHENFNVTVQPLPSDVYTLEEFSNRVKGQAIAVFGRNVVEYRPIHWSWHQGYKMSTVSLHPDHLVMVNAWTVNDGQSYIMTFLGDVYKYRHDYRTVREMVRSFRLE